MEYKTFLHFFKKKCFTWNQKFEFPVPNTGCSSFDSKSMVRFEVYSVGEDQSHDKIRGGSLLGTARCHVESLFKGKVESDGLKKTRLAIHKGFSKGLLRWSS